MSILEKIVFIADYIEPNREQFEGLEDVYKRQVYQLISQGKTEGVFQLESGGMKQFMRELEPTCLEDLIAGISLYRPGCLLYTSRKGTGRTAGTHRKSTPQLF